MVQTEDGKLIFDEICEDGRISSGSICEDGRIIPDSTITKIFTVDVVLVNRNTKTFTTAVVLVKRETKTWSLDIVLKQTITKISICNAILKKTSEKTYAISAILVNHETKTFVVGAQLKILSIKKTFTCDSILVKQATKIFVIDAVLSGKISGITRDSGGAVLGNCTVWLFKTSNKLFIEETTSNASGEYSFDGILTGVSYFVRAFKDGAPNIFGTTDDDLEAN